MKSESPLEIRRDHLSRLLYATDASAYREFPEGVCFPHCREDIVEVVKYAVKNGVSIIPRGAGTSLAGQVVGSGLVVDVSRYFNRIIEINYEERWARVEPGVVLDVLNREVCKGGLFFGPETSTSNRCCLGGMAGNNSCGSHSLVYGSTRDHILEAKAVLYDGSEVEFGDLSPEEFASKQKLAGAEGDIYRFLARMISDDAVLNGVREEFPDSRVRRRNTGYALDEFIGSRYNVCKLLAGSEGTLAFITELKLSLVDLPPAFNMLLCAHCGSLENAFEANLVALSCSPAAVELMDSNILELSKDNLSQSKNRFFVKGDPAAIVIIELNAASEKDLQGKVFEAEKRLIESGFVYYCSHVTAEDAHRVWALRKAGLGLLSSMEGDTKPVSVIEDTAVAPERLPQYMRDFRELLDEYGLDCVFHAHIGTGELHLRPLLNLKKGDDVALFRDLAKKSALLVKKHKGSLSGEHGDGRLRGEFIPLMYGDFLYGVMRDLKRAFDPEGVFNPGKIVDTPRMNSSLRYVPDVQLPRYDTFFRYDAQGGLLGAIEQCNGSGDCVRSSLFGGTMCPSFRITGDELHSTRGRSNVLRELLSRPLSKKVFDQQEIIDALDLCLSCKGCKSECPSNVDITRYKAEFMQHHYDVAGVPFRSFMIAHMADVQRLGSLVPSLYNFFATNRYTSAFLKRVLKFASQREIPSLSRKSLRALARKRVKIADGDAPVVYLFADEFTNYNEAEVGLEFIRLLEGCGYRVVVPAHCESGRAALSKGMLRRARRLAENNVRALRELVSQETPLVGIEPSAILSFRDEYPDLVSDELRNDAIMLSRNVMLYDEFVMREVENGRIDSSMFTENSLEIKLHGHCHQKSLASAEASARMLSVPVNYHAELLDTGCCGMAGSFGFEKEHYRYSVEIGEQKLLPLVRSFGSDIAVSAPGTSCRQQIREGTGRVALHPVQILARALKSS